MELKTETVGEVTVISVCGETLDAETSGLFKEKVLKLLESATDKVILDIDSVEFVDSSGCGAILSSLRRMTEKGGDLKLCNVQKTVRVMLELVRMHRIMDVFNTRDEALTAYSK